MLKQMLEDHVRFELRHWDEQHASNSAIAEFDAILQWLDGATLGDICTVEVLDDLLDCLVFSPPLTDEAFDTVAGAIQAARACAAADSTAVSELLLPEDFQRLVNAVIEMRGLQEGVIEQITTSEVYSRLISHVLYNGIKEYVTSENVITKNVPGASSFMRLGQSAIGTAAPGLSKGIDRQLTAFVNANISETLRESQEYLNDALSPELIREVADEVYRSTSQTTVGEIASQAPEDAVGELIAGGVDLWLHARTTATVRTITAAVIRDFYARWADAPISGLIEAAGLDRDGIIAALSPIWESAIDRARADGLVEERIRARLTAFYEQYEAPEQVAPEGAAQDAVDATAPVTTETEAADAAL